MEECLNNISLLYQIMRPFQPMNNLAKFLDKATSTVPGAMALTFTTIAFGVSVFAGGAYFAEKERRENIYHACTQDESRAVCELKQEIPWQKDRDGAVTSTFPCEGYVQSYLKNKD